MAGSVRVKLRDLVAAIADASTDSVYYVDSRTGEVIKLTRTTNPADLARFKAQSTREPDRFQRAPRPTGEDTYGDIRAFILTVKDRKLQERLSTATSGGGSPRDFLDALAPAPLEKERWFKFRTDRSSARAQEWLRQNGMTPG